MNILGLDPGSKHLGMGSICASTKEVLMHDTIDARGQAQTAIDPLSILEHGSGGRWIDGWRDGDLAVSIEEVGHYGKGMPAGKDVFDTSKLIGKLLYFFELRGIFPELVLRATVKTALCGQANAKKSAVRQAVIDRYGGEIKALGGKKCVRCKGKNWVGRAHDPCPLCDAVWKAGPLHGVKGHEFDALASALWLATKLDQQRSE